MALRGSYKSLTLEAKAEIIKKVECGRSKTEIAAEYGIKKNTLSTYLKNKESILKSWDKEKIAKGRKRMRTAAHDDLEEALLLWTKDALARNLPLSGPILTTKANELAKLMDIKNFKCSEGWLTRFKHRHNIVHKTVCGESADVDLAVCNEFNEKLPELISTYSAKDVFNADETGLFYKLLPNKTMTIKGETCTSGKVNKDRITVMVAANMDGSEKLKLLVIGKARKPRCFKGIKTLPIDYASNSKAWMTREICINWLKELDKTFSRQNRKILLLLDNVQSHCKIPTLNSIKIEYLPPNTTAKLQPMDQGIIQNLKTHYRKRVLEQILFSMDVNESYNITLLSAINDLYAAWDAVKPETIQNCFRHAGFIHPSEKSVCINYANDENEKLFKETEFPNFSEKFQCDITFAEYVAADNNLEITGPLTVEEIVETIQEKCTEEKISDSEDADTVSEMLSLPSAKLIAQSIECLRTFILFQPSSDKELNCLLQIEKLAKKSEMGRAKQTTIDRFFNRNVK